jgi:TetR/AcrR family transcriptional regulator
VWYDYNAVGKGVVNQQRQRRMQNSEISNPADSANKRPTQGNSERDRRRQDILDAARKFFEQKGYRGTAMAEIAETANLAVGTLYKFFRDKRDLYQTLVAATMHDFERQLTAALRGSEGDELARLHAFIDLGSKLFVEHLAIIRVYFAETGAAFLFSTAGLEDEAFLSYDRIAAALEETFRRGVERGVFVDLEPAALAMALEGVHNAFLATLVRDSERYTPEQIATLTKRIFFETVLRR